MIGPFPRSKRSERSPAAGGIFFDRTHARDLVLLAVTVVVVIGALAWHLR